MRKSRLPKTEVYLFQEIKKVCVEAEESGTRLFKLSIGQPTGPALLSARQEASRVIISKEESIHGYQDNGEPGVPGFSKAFVQAHMKDFDLSSFKDISYLPIPGIKPMLGLVIMACGGVGELGVNTMTEPGYPVPETWSSYLEHYHYSCTLNVDNKFLFDPKDEMGDSDNLFMLNYPHNPSGQIATRKWWEELCSICERKDVRVFNDAAYAMLAHSNDACTLTEVAVNYPDLSWAEAFSASKVIGNGTGWRIGAMCGSPDFIGDIATIKSNTDSGFNAALAHGVYCSIKTDMDSIRAQREKYKERLDILIKILTERGIRLAVEPKAGFFTLWSLPKKAFGEEIQDAKHFNFMMIEKTGVVGVHFHPYIRYAVVAPIEQPDFTSAIKKAFDEAKVEY